MVRFLFLAYVVTGAIMKHKGLHRCLRAIVAIDLVRNIHLALIISHFRLPLSI